MIFKQEEKDLKRLAKEFNVDFDELLKAYKKTNEKFDDYKKTDKEEEDEDERIEEQIKDVEEVQKQTRLLKDEGYLIESETNSDKEDN